MATLQRSTAFRRQGSSGSVWDDKYCLVGDKEERRELRPCQSARNIGMMDYCSDSNAVPTTCPRSLSTPAMNHTSFNAFGKAVHIPIAKSRKGKLLANILSGNKWFSKTSALEMSFSYLLLSFICFFIIIIFSFVYSQDVFYHNLNLL